MRLRLTAVLVLTAALSACRGESVTTTPIVSVPPNPPVPPTPPATSPVLLRDMIVSRLPAPYYHFGYDTLGRVSTASFAAGLRSYDVTFGRDGITEMVNNVAGGRERLGYIYDDSGRVAAVKYFDAGGQLYVLLFFSYDGAKLVDVERDRRVQGGYIVDKTISLSYYPDGNLRALREHHPPVDGRQTESTTTDVFENYDDGINVDGFALIHDEFFDHLVLLPGVQLQKNNPARVTRTGDGINFGVSYVYEYDAMHRPLVKRGDLTVTNGTDAGQRSQISTEFSYY